MQLNMSFTVQLENMMNISSIKIVKIQIELFLSVLVVQNNSWYYAMWANDDITIPGF